MNPIMQFKKWSTYDFFSGLSLASVRDKNEVGKGKVMSDSISSLYGMLQEMCVYICIAYLV